MNQPLKIILVEDHSLCRSGLTDLLNQRGQMHVAAATGDAERVPALLEEHQPFIQKPFTPAGLALGVRSLLDGGAVPRTQV